MTFLKKKIQNFFLFMLSILLIFLILELILIFVFKDKPRSKSGNNLNDQPISFVEDKILGWKPKPGEYIFDPWSEHGEVTKLTNLKDGSRITGSSNKKNKIIFIGGSLTQGWAVDDKNNYPALLQKKIKNFS